MLEGKLIDPVQADAEWARNTNHSQVRDRRGGGDPDLMESKAKREAALASMAELELAQMEGRLVDVSEVETALATKIRGVRDALLLLPDRLAAILAAESDPRKLRARMDEELRLVLDGLTGSAE